LACRPGWSLGVMGLLSNRNSKKTPVHGTETGTSSPNVPEAKAQAEGDDAREAAAAKLQAISRGKKARFEDHQKKDAAMKIQAIKRGHQVRADTGGRSVSKQDDPLKNAKMDPLVASASTSSTPARPSGRTLQRRVSFGSQGIVGSSPGSATTVQDKLQSKLMQFFTPCLEPMQAYMAKTNMPCLPQPKPTEEAEVDVAVPSSKLAVAAATEAPRVSKDTSKQLLSSALFEKVKILFDKIDGNGDGQLTHEEARIFWGKNFAKVNAQAMFNEVDDDGNGAVTFAEWISFWENVISQEAYKNNEEEVLEELDSIISGGSWVDWDDGRNT